MHVHLVDISLCIEESLSDHDVAHVYGLECDVMH